MNKTLLQIASFLLIPAMIVADPATAMGFAAVVQDSHRPACAVFSLEMPHRLDQEALAAAALSSRGLARLVTVVPHGFHSLFTFLPADLKKILFSKSVRYSAVVMGILATHLSEGTFWQSAGIGALMLSAIPASIVLFYPILSLVSYLLPRRSSSAVKRTAMLLVISLIAASGTMANPAPAQFPATSYAPEPHHLILRTVASIISFAAFVWFGRQYIFPKRELIAYYPWTPRPAKILPYEVKRRGAAAPPPANVEAEKPAAVAPAVVKPSSIASAYGSYAKYVIRHEPELKAQLVAAVGQLRLKGEELPTSNSHALVKALVGHMEPEKLVMDRDEKTEKEIAALRAVYARNPDLKRDIRRAAALARMSVARAKKLFFFASMSASMQKDLSALVLALEDLRHKNEKLTPQNAAARAGLTVQRARELFSVAMSYPHFDDPVAFRILVKGVKTYKNSPAFNALVKELLTTGYAKEVLKNAARAAKAASSVNARTPSWKKSLRPVPAPAVTVYGRQASRFYSAGYPSTSSFHSLVGLIPLFWMLTPKLLAIGGHLYQQVAAIHWAQPHSWMNVLAWVSFSMVAIVLQKGSIKEWLVKIKSMQNVADVLRAMQMEAAQEVAATQNVLLKIAAEKRLTLLRALWADAEVYKDIPDTFLENAKELFKQYPDAAKELRNDLRIIAIAKFVGLSLEDPEEFSTVDTSPLPLYLIPDAERFAQQDTAKALSANLGISAHDIARAIRPGSSYLGGYVLPRVVKGLKNLKMFGAVFHGGDITRDTNGKAEIARLYFHFKNQFFSIILTRSSRDLGKWYASVSPLMSQKPTLFGNVLTLREIVRSLEETSILLNGQEGKPVINTDRRMEQAA